jgi:hypothetical protein
MEFNMQRIYFLVPDKRLTQNIVTEVEAAGIAERHIHVIAAENVELEDLPEASLLQKSDFLSALERGLPVGAATGLLTGLVTLVIPGGVALSGGALLACMAAGAGIGSWMGSMVALDIPISRHREFQEAVDSGSFLMLLDVPKDRVQDIEDLILRHHAEAELGRVEPSVLSKPPGY